MGDGYTRSMKKPLDGRLFVRLRESDGAWEYPAGRGSKRTAHEPLWPIGDQGCTNECWLWCGETVVPTQSGPTFLPAASPKAFGGDGVLMHGATPLGLAVRRRCHTPGCVNPAHVSFDLPDGTN
jgi:hypothetical protein